MSKEIHYIKKIKKLESTSSKNELKGKKTTGKQKTRIDRNYKKREQSVKETDNALNDFRKTFLTSIQDRFINVNPIVKTLIEFKYDQYRRLGGAYSSLYQNKEILMESDNIAEYQDRLFQSRIGNISTIDRVPTQYDSTILHGQNNQGGMKSLSTKVTGSDGDRVRSDQRQQNRLEIRSEQIGFDKANINFSKKGNIDTAQFKDIKAQQVESDEEDHNIDGFLDFDAFNLNKRENKQTATAYDKPKQPQGFEIKFKNNSPQFNQPSLQQNQISQNNDFYFNPNPQTQNNNQHESVPNHQYDSTGFGQMNHGVEEEQYNINNPRDNMYYEDNQPTQEQLQVIHGFNNDQNNNQQELYREERTEEDQPVEQINQYQRCDSEQDMSIQDIDQLKDRLNNQMFGNDLNKRRSQENDEFQYF